ncbi:MAG: hypothetical protein QXP36_14300 [Conexivisphaerales archaeon]
MQTKKIKLKKTWSSQERPMIKFLSSLLLGYLVAFFVLINPYVVNEAQAGSVSTLPKNSFEMNDDPGLIWSVTNGFTKLSNNVSADYRVTNTFTDTAPVIIAHYTPLAEEGQIGIAWIHRFPDQNSYQKWLSAVQSAGEWGNPSQGYIWYSTPVQNANALPYQVAIFHLITPQELFKLGPYAMPSANTQASNYGKVFGSSYNYNQVAYCSQDNTGGAPCSDLAYKVGFNGFIQIVAEVAREYHTQSGVLVVDQQTTHQVVSKSSSVFRTTVTVKVYLDTTPIFYQIVPNTTPGITQMGNNGGIIQASSTDGGVGLIQVQQGLGEWGYNFSGTSQLIYQKSESGWNTIGAIFIGLGGFLLGVATGQLWLSTISLSYAGLSTVELAVVGHQQFYGVTYYNLGTEFANSNEVTRNAITFACAYWGDMPMGGQPASGNQYILNQFATTQPIDYSGMTVGAYEPSANEQQILQSQ